MIQRLNSAGTAKSVLSVRERKTETEREKERDPLSQARRNNGPLRVSPLTFVLPMAALNLILFPKASRQDFGLGFPEMLQPTIRTSKMSPSSAAT